MKEKEDDIQRVIQDIVGVDTYLKRKKKTKKDEELNTFINTISALSLLNDRAKHMSIDWSIDFNVYEKPFYSVIDNLFLLKYGEQGRDLIFFFLYEQYNPDGTKNELTDIEGFPIILDDAEDLYYLLKKNETKEKHN